MPWKRYALPALLAGVALAQTTSTSLPTRTKGSTQGNGSTFPGTQPTTRSTTPTNRREPCWQVAGVSKSAMEQRHVIEQKTRQEVEAVCANASLPAAQKQERIRAIHQQERQQMEALISPQQREAMRACQQQRGGGVRVGGGGGHLGGGHGAGPCGSLPGLGNRMNESEPDESKP